MIDEIKTISFTLTLQKRLLTLESQGRDAEQRIILVDVPDAKPENTDAVEQLRRIEKIVESVWGHIIVGQRHKGYFPIIHFLTDPGQKFPPGQR